MPPRCPVCYAILLLAPSTSSLLQAPELLISRRDALAGFALSIATAGPREDTEAIMRDHARRFVRGGNIPSTVQPVQLAINGELQPMRQLVATVDLEAFVKVAAYPVEVIDYHEDYDGTYALAVYHEDELNYYSSTFADRIGIPTRKSLARKYVRGVPTLAMYANEPSQGQAANCIMSFPHSMEKPRVGTVEYGYLQTTRAVRRGDALTWCYGDVYSRPYRTSCNTYAYFEDPALSRLLSREQAQQPVNEWFLEGRQGS